MITAVELTTFDTIIVACSGGKDSVASVLHLLELGADPGRIELWHHDVDGREGSALMDWPVTRDYCRKFAAALGLTMYFSWKVGGFEREMLRHDTPTAPTRFETPEGISQAGGTRGKPGTREKFPQISADLSVRWCSAYLKIDVSAIAIRNQPRFRGKKVLVVSGERGEESPCRARYADVEPDKADGPGRDVTRWRPIKHWTEQQVWAILERWKINPHPCYWLGWGRCSCAGCIFGSENQWASLRRVNPHQFRRIASYETQFGYTIRRAESIEHAADRGQPYAAITEERIAVALAETFDQPIILDTWTLPAGAYGDSAGPL